MSLVEHVIFAKAPTQRLVLAEKPKAAAPKIEKIVPSVSTTNLLPSKIVCKYTDDYDIGYVHEVITQKLQQQQKDIGLLSAKLSTEKDRILQPQTILQRKQCLKRIHEVTEEIKAIKSSKRYHEYLEKVGPILQKYRQLYGDRRKVSFTVTPKEDVNLQKRLQIIREYLNVAQDYIDLDIRHSKEVSNNCPNCNFDLENVYIDDSGNQNCPECGLERYVPNHWYIQETGGKEMIENDDYEDEENYLRTIRCFSGKERDNLPANLFPDLDAYFQNYGLPIGDEIRKLPLLENGTKDGTDRQLMIKALSDKGYSECYSHLNLICHLYWGYRLPDISHLEEKLLERYRKTQKVYNRLKKGRKWSLNTQYRLCQDLLGLGYDCRVEDFKMIDTPEIRDEHDDIYKQVCEELNDPEIKFIPWR